MIIYKILNISDVCFSKGFYFIQNYFVLMNIMCSICRYATAKHVFVNHKKPVTEGRDLSVNISNLLFLY